MGAALASFFRHLPVWKNVVIGSQLTDETFGVAVTQLSGKSRGNYWWMFGLNLTAYLNWLLANMAGGIFGEWITQPESFGLDFALPAMFIGLLMLQLMERSKIVIDLVVACSAVITVIIGSVYVSSNIGVLLATILAATIGVCLEKQRERGNNKSWK